MILSNKCILLICVRMMNVLCISYFKTVDVARTFNKIYNLIYVANCNLKRKLPTNYSTNYFFRIFWHAARQNKSSQPTWLI